MLKALMVLAQLALVLPVVARAENCRVPRPDIVVPRTVMDTAIRDVSRQPVIQVLSASYGHVLLPDSLQGVFRCPVVPVGNATSSIKRSSSSCEGMPSCSYPITTKVLGDPAPGCWKQFSVTYRCGDSTKTFSVGGARNNEANGQTALLSCGAITVPDTVVTPRIVLDTMPDPAEPVIADGTKYAKVDAAGHYLPATAPAWSCVVDLQSGLMWENKESLGWGLRGQRNTYTWYDSSSATNGGGAGKPGDAPTNGDGGCGGAGSISACDTRSYARAMNRVGLCGRSDGWRIPTLNELNSLVTRMSDTIFIDTNYFANTVRLDWYGLPGYAPVPYWSSTTFTGAPAALKGKLAWTVVFEKSRFTLDGQALYLGKHYTNHVRAVRSCTR